MEEAIENLEHSPNASTNAAEAIMTTDTFSKEISVETNLITAKKFELEV